MGLECIGCLEEGTAAQVVSLAVSSLALTERDFVLELSHMGFVSGLMDAVGAPEGVRPQLLRCIRDKNRHELRRCAAQAGLSPQGTGGAVPALGAERPLGDGDRRGGALALNAAMGSAWRSCGRCARSGVPGPDGKSEAGPVPRQ